MEATKEKSGGIEDHPYEIGKAYFFKTVTMYYVGRLKRITKMAFVLTNVTWVGDTGLQSKAFTEGTFQESDPLPMKETYIHIPAVIEVTEWAHPLRGERPEKK